MGLARDVVLDEAGHDHGGAVGLTADFYNRVCMPLFAAMVAILSICPWLGWNGGVATCASPLWCAPSRRGRRDVFPRLHPARRRARRVGDVAALVSMSLKLFEGRIQPCTELRRLRHPHRGGPHRARHRLLRPVQDRIRTHDGYGRDREGRPVRSHLQKPV
ncbi:MAG: hypothetical protein ACLSAH_02850 [Bilophila wadsworthia]